MLAVANNIFKPQARKTPSLAHDSEDVSSSVPWFISCLRWLQTLATAFIFSTFFSLAQSLNNDDPLTRRPFYARALSVLVLLERNHEHC